MATDTTTPNVPKVSPDSNNQPPNGYQATRPKFQFNAATFDSILLAILILAMCSQMNVRALGEDTLAEGKGFATKQLFIALSDVLLVLTFGWFVLRTTLLRAWKRLWWPPAPCWALIIALLIATVHSQSILNSIASSLGAVEQPGPKGMVKALITKESKEALASIIQYVAYFLCAPLLFVNLIHDRRAGELISRRRLALHIFPVAILIATVLSLFQWFTAKDNPPHGLFGSANIYGGFLAMALPLMIAHMLKEWQRVPQVFFSVGLALLLGIATISSIWVLLAVLIGIVVAGLLTRQVARAGVLAVITVLLAGVVWRNAFSLASNTSEFRKMHAQANKDPKDIKHPTKLVRADFLRVPSQSQKVRKQYIEWFATLGWSMPRPGGDLPEGERLRAFATGVGPGNYQQNIGPYYNSLPNEEKMPPDSNNLYLVEAVSTGVLGLGALIWMLTYFAGRALQTRPGVSGDWLGAGVAASLAAFAFVNLFHPLIVRGTGLVLAFILSLAIIAWQSNTIAGNENRTDR